MTADLRIRVVDDARAAIRQFGVNDGIHEGYVGWIGFLRMITKKPWKNHLPENIQKKLPIVTIQLQRQMDEQAVYEKEMERRQEVRLPPLLLLFRYRAHPPTDRPTDRLLTLSCPTACSSSQKALPLKRSNKPWSTQKW